MTRSYSHTLRRQRHAALAAAGPLAQAFLPLVARKLFEAHAGALREVRGSRGSDGCAHLGHVEARSPAAAFLDHSRARGRNTAAHCARRLRLAPDDVHLVCPSDHISRRAAFAEARAGGSTGEQAGWSPSALRTAPETGFGSQTREPSASRLPCRQFVENPIWNAPGFPRRGYLCLERGIFAFRVAISERAPITPAIASAPPSGRKGGGWTPLPSRRPRFRHDRQ